MEKETIVAVVLGVLVLFAVVQAFQLSGLKNAVSGGATVNTASAPAPAPQAQQGGQGPSLPPSLQSLPDMVGGC